MSSICSLPLSVPPSDTIYLLNITFEYVLPSQCVHWAASGEIHEKHKSPHVPFSSTHEIVHLVGCADQHLRAPLPDADLILLRESDVVQLKGRLSTTRGQNPDARGAAEKDEVWTDLSAEDMEALSSSEHLFFFNFFI